MSYALQFLAGQQWAIQPSVLEAMADIAQRKAVEGGDITALLKRDGLPINGARTAINRDGVAIVPVTGVVSRYASMFTDICGGTTTARLATDIETALNDTSVRALVLDFDTPGGQVTGINELADQLFDARGKKPVIAYGGGSVASAGYWLASACDEIVVDATSLLGSIGVVATYRLTKDSERVQTIELVSARSPNKRPDLNSDAGRAKAQESIDAMADIFIGRVARHRGMSADEVVAAGDAGGVLIGQQAVDVGLADRLGSLESVIAELSGSSRTTTIGRVAAKPATAATPAANTQQEGNETMCLTIEKGATATAVATALEAQHPEAFAALVQRGKDEATAEQATAIKAARDEGYAEGKAAETARVAGVFEQSMPGHEALIQTLALDGETTGEQAAVKVLAAERKAGSDFLEAAGSSESNKVAESAQTGGKSKVSSTDLAKEASALVREAEAKGERLSYAAAVRQLNGGAQ